MSRWGFLVSVRWITWFVGVVFFAIACHFLAQWQLGRQAEAAAQIRLIEHNYNAEPVPVQQELGSLDAYSPKQQWLPVSLTGRYLTDRELLVRNRPCNNASGYDVLTPFELNDGTVFIVDRGCLNDGQLANTAQSYAPPPSGTLTISARLAQGEPAVAGRTDVGDTVGSIDLHTLSKRFTQPMYVGAYGQLMGGDPNQAPFPADKPEEDPGPFLSYAFQWYVFAVIGFVAYGWAANQERRNRENDALEDPDDEDLLSELPELPDAPHGFAATTDADLSERYGVSGAGGRRGRIRGPSRRTRKSDAELEDELLDALSSQNSDEPAQASSMSSR